MTEHALTTSELIDGTGQSSGHAAKGATQQQAQDGDHVLGGPPGARLHDEQQRIQHHSSHGPAQHRHYMQQHALRATGSSFSVCSHGIAWHHIASKLPVPGQISFWLLPLAEVPTHKSTHSRLYHYALGNTGKGWGVGIDSDFTLYEAAGRETASKDATSTITAVYSMTSHHVFRLKTAARM